MRKEVIEALKLIGQRLNNQGIKWMVVGGTSLALQGVDVESHDIDILTNEEGAFRIAELLKEYEVEPMRFKCSELFRSYLGEFEIKGVKVEVMGDLEAKMGGKWVRVEVIPHESVEVEGVEIPVPSLREQLKAYEMLGREKDKEKMQKIREVLKKKAHESEPRQPSS